MCDCSKSGKYQYNKLSLFLISISSGVSVSFVVNVYERSDFKARVQDTDVTLHVFMKMFLFLLYGTVRKCVKTRFFEFFNALSFLNLATLPGLLPLRVFISLLSCAGVHDNAGVRLGQEKSICQASFFTVLVNVGDPDPQDPHVFGTSGSGSFPFLQ